MRLNSGFETGYLKIEAWTVVVTLWRGLGFGFGRHIAAVRDQWWKGRPR